MKRWLRIALALQLAFFAVWGYRLLNAFDNAAEVILETIPVDPRDYLYGHYVALNYAIGNRDKIKQLPGCDSIVAHKLSSQRKFYLRLENATPYATAVECSLEAPANDDARLWLRAETGWRIKFGIERFYVPETSPLRTAKSGEVAARVAINRQRQAKILSLDPLNALK